MAFDSLDFNSMSIPDRLRPLLGIRQFLVDNGGMLKSPNRVDAPWGRKWKTAACITNDMMGSRPPHTSPDMTGEVCGHCGFYAAYDYEHLMSHITPTWNEKALFREKDTSVVGSGYRRTVYGLIAVRGNVSKGKSIMRVEQARVVSLVDVPHETKGKLPTTELEDLAWDLNFPLEYFTRIKEIESRIEVYTNIADRYGCDYDHPHLMQKRKEGENELQ